MQIHRTTAAIALTAIALLAGFNAYQAHVIKVQRSLIVDMLHIEVAYGQYTLILEQALAGFNAQLTACLHKK